LKGPACARLRQTYVVTSNIGRVEAKRAREESLRARDKVSEYERLSINWNYAARVLEDKKATKEALELLTTSYPRDFAAKNNFGVYYNNNGDFEDALKQYQAATEIAPDEPGPLSNAAYVLFAMGRVDEGSASVDRALELRPDGNLAIARWICARVLRHARRGIRSRRAKLANPDQQAVADWIDRGPEGPPHGLTASNVMPRTKPEPPATTPRLTASRSVSESPAECSFRERTSRR
jgi:tetratricopeptide (TPR) repeat protein